MKSAVYTHVRSLRNLFFAQTVSPAQRRKGRRLLAQFLAFLLAFQASVLPLTATDNAGVVRSGKPSEKPATHPIRTAQPAPSPVQESRLAANIVLSEISTSFNGLAGIEYHQANHKLLVTANVPAGQPRNFELIASDGAHTAFSNVAGLTGELKPAVARDDVQGKSLAGFDQGEVFVGTAAPGVIARISANGATIRNPWVTLPNESGTVSSLHIDRTNLFGGHVIAVTSSGKIWRVNAQAQATLVASLNLPLSGVITVPNDASKYGPWSGRILVGVPIQSTLYAVDATGASTPYALGINPSDLKLIPSNENFYGIDAATQKIWGAPDDAFTAMIGDLLIAQASPGHLMRARWNGTSFETEQLAQVGGWKQITFAPAGATPIADAGRFYQNLALIRHGLSFDSGRIEGAVWQTLPEAITLTGNATLTSDLLVPGTPTFSRSNNSQFAGIIDGPGNLQPTNYSVTLTGSPAMRHLVRRVDPVALPTVTAPPLPTGTRDIQLNNSNQNPGDWATVRDLTLTGKIPNLSVPPGTYGNFNLSGNNVVVLGVAGATTPLNYNLQSLQVGGSCEIQVLSPVVLTVKNAVSFSGGAAGNAIQPSQLRLSISNSGLTLDGNSKFYGLVRAPLGTVAITGNARLRGTVICDTLNVNGSGLLQLTDNDVPAPPVNRPPSVNAGADQTLIFPNTATLQGTVSDDGLPTGGTVTQSWSVVSGPGAVTFANANAPTTTATFGQPGTYELRLTASDTLLTSSDTVVITLNQQNQAPTANAGSDQAISLPTNTVTLAGTASDDGLPQGSTLTYLWSKVSGPGAVNFGNASSAGTTANFSASGLYTLRLTVSDSALSATDDINILVNQPPAVNAGADQTINFPTTSVNLTGNVSDDGLPPGSIVSLTWSKVSGPGNVTFSTPTLATTTATFATPGTYVLRLTADDTLVSASDDVTINVLQQNQAPVVHAGADQTISLPTNSVSLTGTAMDDGLPQGAALTYTWSRASGPGTVTFSNANALTTTATFSTSGSYTLRLSVSDTQLTGVDEVNITVNAPPTVSAGTDKIITLPTNSLSLTGTATDDGLPTGSGTSVSWSKLSGPGTVTFSNATALTTTATFSAGGVYTLRLTASDSLASSTDDIVVTVNTAPTVNAGADQLISAPINTVNLTGTVTDDGLPGGTSVSWSKLTGPGSVTFGNAASATTTATFSTNGVYILRLTAADGAATSADDITISVNTAPTVNAGPDLTIALPTNTVTLQGSATDDGLPSGPLNYTWTKVSGPGAVSFGNAGNPVTTASFASVGTYVLRLTVSDGAATGSDDVMITVNPGGNQAPVVSAGPDRLIAQRPYFIVGLQGSVMDDGLPAGGTLTMQWTKVSGPGQVFFTPSNGPTPNVSFLLPGIYVLRLTASDGQLSASDEVVVSVNAAPVVNAGVGQIIPTTQTTVNLSGSATDDGLPAGAPLTYTWSKLNGPGTVTFGNVNSATTTATFSQPGTYVLLLTVSDSAMSDSDVVAIGNSNVAPFVDAGPNINLFWPDEDAAFLAGYAIDPDTPNGIELEYKWTQVSGPATAEIDFDDSDGTDVYFSAPGIYVFRLSVYDGFVTVSDQVTVNVAEAGNRAPNVTITAPLPSNWLINWPLNTFTLQGSVNDDGLPAGAPLTYTWSKVRGPGDVSFANPNSLLTTASFSAPGIYQLRLAASDTQYTGEADVTVGLNLPPSVDAGPERVLYLPPGGSVSATLLATTTDDGLPFAHTYTWTLQGGPNAVSFLVDNGSFSVDYTHALNPIVTFSAPGVYILKLTATDTTATASDTVAINVLPRNQAPSVNAGPDRSLTLPIANSLTLTGTVTDDGLPTGPLAVNWSKLSGPGTVTFANAQTQITSATFSAAGVYTLRLTANDGEFASNDDVVITVNATNQAPIVNAGPDQQLVPLPNTLALNGSVSDDNAPLGAPLTVTWSQVSGPASVSFAPANTPATTATFNAKGTYVLRLTASDTQFTVSDDVQVTVGCNANSANLDVALILDRSGSMEGQPFIDSKAAAKAFLDRLQLATNDQIAVISFGDPAAVNQTLTHNATQAKAVIDGLTIDSINGSNVESGLTQAYQELLSARHNPAAQRVIVLLTDGQANRGFPPIEVATTVKAAGIRILTIGFGVPSAINASTMRAIASSHYDFFYAPTAADLGLAYGYIAGSLCRNLPPVANAGPDFNVFQPATATLLGAASDDGAPSSASLSTQWSQVSGPAQATLLTPTQLTTTALFPQTGSYVFRLTVTDTFLTATDDVTVTVLSEPSLAGATLTLTTANAATNQVGTPVTAVATLKNASNQPIPNFGMRINLTGANAANGSSATGLTNAAGQFSFTYTGTNSGSDLLTAIAQGTGQSLASNNLTFNWTVTTQIPILTQGWLVAPLHQSKISDLTPITLNENIALASGTINVCGQVSTVSPASADEPQNELQQQRRQQDGEPTHGPAASDNNSAALLPRVISTLDPTQLPNGKCTISLDATTTTGEHLISQVLVHLVGENKPGRVTLKVNEFTVPAAGFPLTITREYDSSNRAINGDFGYGWALDVYATRLEEAPDYGVTFTDPASGRRVHFDFTPQSYGGLVGFLYQPAYTAEAGFYGTLTAQSCGLVGLSESKWTCIFSAGYQATSYTYTDPYGRKFVMGPAGELRSMTDLSGNTLTVTPNGITSSTGLSVPFVRDGQGRITQITDTASKVYRYNYDATGNLDNVELPTLATRPSYTYTTDHHLLTAKDARGNTEATMTYHPDGRLATVRDAVGNVTSYAYDLVNRTTTRTNPDTGTEITRTDAYGLLLSQTDALNKTTTFGYDANRNLTSETNALNQTKQYTYDSRGNRLTATDPANQKATASYNQYGAPVALSDPLGNAVTITYDAQGLPIELRDSLGLLARLTYDSKGSKLSETDGTGATKTYSYDQYGNQIAAQDALGNTQRWTYDPMGRVAQYQSARAGVTRTYTYDDLGRLTRVQEALGYQMLYEYDGNGNRTAMTDARTNRTTYTYDAANRVTQVTYPDTTTVSYTYNHRGQRLTATDQNNRTTSYEYDKNGRLTKVTHPDTSYTTTTYDDLGRVRTQTDERFNTTTYEYDPGCSCSGRVTKVIDALTRFTQSKYDAAGRLSASIDQLGRETKYQYDARGRVITTVFPDNTSTSSVYDGANRVIRQTDQTNKAMQYEYDGRGSLKAVTNALNQRTSYSYDADGNLARMTPASGNPTSYEYNLRNQRSRQVLPNGADELYTYDVAGNLASKRGANGKLTSYGYDALNRLSSITPDASLGESTISYTYKLNGQRATLTDVSGTTTYNYDNRNRLMSKQTPFGTLSYGYDATSNLTSTQSSNANGLSVTYGYDALNRLQTVTDNRIAPGVTSYLYDEVGNLKNTTQPNGVQHDYTYNPVNLLTQLNVVKGAGTLARYTYTHTAARLRASMTELNGRTVTYAYDDANQLNSETITNAPQAAQNGIISYLLDAVGNRLQRNSTASAISSTVNTFNSANQLNTDSYDLNGNTVAADGKTFTYDFRDKLKSVNSGAITLAYDGDGNRVRKTVSGMTTSYLVDELNPTGYVQVVEELVGGQVQRVYTYGNALISQRQLIAGNWVTSHYGYDGSMNVRVLTDAAGVVTDTFDYDAFGNLIGRTGTTPNNYLYRGQQFDVDLGFYYNRARYYSAQRGRFFTQDAFEGSQNEPRSLHKYLYAHAEPVNSSDPSGLAQNVEKGLLSSLSARVANALGPAGVANLAKSEIARLAPRYLNAAISCAIYALASLADVPGYPTYTRFDTACAIAPAVIAITLMLVGAGTKDDKEESKRKRILYRGEKSSLGPNIVFTQGLKPKGVNPDLLAHLLGTPDSGYIATSKKFDVAAVFAGKNGWIYIVRTDRGIDVNEALGSKSPYPEQEEVSIFGGVYPSEIVGAFDLKNYKIESFIPNPAYVKE